MDKPYERLRNCVFLSLNLMFFVGLNVYTTLYNTFALALANETAIKLDFTYLI